MLNKKVLIYIFIFLLIFTFNTRAVTENEKEIAEIRNFIYDVYYNYQYNNYDFVYESMHFEIKEVLKKENYINFQTKNTERISLKLSEVQVINVKLIDEWPEEFESIITDKDNHKLYEIEIEYMTNYENNGKKQEKLINKKTYVSRYDNSNYLLWDPEIINN
jgi:hypothetical protein